MDLGKIIQVPFPVNQYHRVETPKKQIVLHHTASGEGAKGDIEYWKSDAVKIATSFVIGRDGTIYQLFSSKYYAAHLGIPASFLKSKKFKDFGTRCDALHKGSIGIELDSWGWLTKKADGKFYTYTNEIVKNENVIAYDQGFLGQRYFEKYTDKQIASTKELLQYLCETWKIDKSYQSDMFGVSDKALRGESGIFAHVSYRESGKWDVHPQYNLIEMLKSL